MRRRNGLISFKVRLVELSARQEDVMTVLLTGRAENGFADPIKRMVAAKKLEFDMICLKPTVGPSGQRFGSTMLYKQALLKDIIFTYTDVEELKIYEDRPKQWVDERTRQEALLMKVVSMDSVSLLMSLRESCASILLQCPAKTSLAKSSTSAKLPARSTPKSKPCKFNAC